MAGVDLRTVSDLLGHQSIQMTMRYSHLAPDHRQSAVDKLVSVATGTTTGTSQVSQMAASERRAESALAAAG